mgnify:CR=1 FL=1
MVRKSHQGKWATFHGFDGNAYAAQIVRVYKGVAIIQYRVKGELCQAYVDKPFHNRVGPPTPNHYSRGIACCA